MATAYVEYGRPASVSAAGFQAAAGGATIPGPCVASETLTISGVAATGAIVGATATKTVARIVTDTACFYAVGTTPDPTAVAINGLVTTARRYLPAASAMEVPLAVGAKVAVIAVA